MNDYKWLNKRTPRSVEELRTWPENPRLQSEEEHITVQDYVEDLIFFQQDRDAFCKLIESISHNGFIPSDPIVVWQNDKNSKYYVAEGNRRILALKLLLNPQKAPRSIRSLVRKNSELIDLESIKKVMVTVAPSFDDAEWYINQRNNISTLQRNWSRIQQIRWITLLYEKYKGNIAKIAEITSMDVSDIESFIRIFKVHNFFFNEEVKNLLTPEEYTKAISKRFPITILERFIFSKEVKEKWGLICEGADVKIISERVSFFTAFAELIKQIVNSNINTRFTNTDIPEMLTKLPEVIFDGTPIESKESDSETRSEFKEENDDKSSHNESEKETPRPPMKNDPNRNRLIAPMYELNTSNMRLSLLFKELKQIPFKYSVAISASIRVFLDIAVNEYIQSEGIETISVHHTLLKDTTLNNRLQYLQENKFNGEVKRIVMQLLNPENQYSLSVLNGFVHSDNTCFSSHSFLNGFWDFLFPLFKHILEIKEVKK